MSSVELNEVRGFGIFGVFGWVCSLVLVEELGSSSVFPDLGLGSAHFWVNRFKVQAFGRALSGLKVRFWWTNLSSRFDRSSSKQFEVRYIWVWYGTNMYIYFFRFRLL